MTTLGWPATATIDVALCMSRRAKRYQSVCAVRATDGGYGVTRVQELMVWVNETVSVTVNR